MAEMALTDTAIKNAKPKDKAYKLADEKGLHLLVHPSGGLLWRMKYRVDSAGNDGQPKRVEKLLSFGSYPEISLKGARALRDDARKQLAEGIDPGQTKKEAKIATMLGAANSFAAVAEEYIASMEQEGRAQATMDVKRRSKGTPDRRRRGTPFFGYDVGLLKMALRCVRRRAGVARPEARAAQDRFLKAPKVAVSCGF
ncbi:phage integrase family protein [Sphingobium cloacae]|uniref:Phage integrase family protein n=1 Tax=Sphingobium cloacae TaxID=120107 RepID=A0A1E1F475_9SPHN|nr:phage integrase family protein [Sphingobium cloacae]